MKGWSRKGTKGRPVVFRTWLAVWMELKKMTIPEFARVLMVGTASVERWRSGKGMGRHNSMLTKAFFPDCPINALGGNPPRLNEPLPSCARSVDMYKFIFKLGGVIDDLAHPAALAKARGVGEYHRLKVEPATNSVQPTIPPPHH